MLNELLKQRGIPELMKTAEGAPVTRENWTERRRELLDLLAEYEYGAMPGTCGETRFAKKWQGTVAAGLAERHAYDVTFPVPDGGTFTFPVSVDIPHGASADDPLPAIVHISFGNPNYYPQEEVMEQGVIVAEFVMNDVAFDGEDNWSTKLSPHLIRGGQRTQSDPGKIGMWAFAASRVLDLLLTLDCVDPRRVGVMGHSRLGKTALWAGANDERFTHVFSNESGCSGAAITRGKVGETFPRIAKVFPYWFGGRMQEISGSVEASESAPFDQHFLLAAIAPRKLYVSSAIGDQWSDPVSEYLGCAAASPAWELAGLRGFDAPDRLPEIGDVFADGAVGYHLRAGEHYLSRHDWTRFAAFLKK